MKIRMLTVLLLAILVFNFVGCAKCISTEYENVEVTIVDEYHRNTWLQPIYTGKSTVLITHPAVYQITVRYNDVEYTIDDSDTYDKYKDKIGQTAVGKLEVRTYDNGNISYDITSLE